MRHMLTLLYALICLVPGAHVCVFMWLDYTGGILRIALGTTALLALVLGNEGHHVLTRGHLPLQLHFAVIHETTSLTLSLGISDIGQLKLRFGAVTVKTWLGTPII
jgi:hypothetical protein